MLKSRGELFVILTADYCYCLDDARMLMVRVSFVIRSEELIYFLYYLKMKKENGASVHIARTRLGIFVKVDH